MIKIIMYFLSLEKSTQIHSSIIQYSLILSHGINQPFIMGPTPKSQNSRYVMVGRSQNTIYYSHNHNNISNYKRGSLNANDQT